MKFFHSLRMGTSFKCRSFVLGALFASTMWGIIIYVYVTLLEMNLESGPSRNHAATLPESPIHENQELFNINIASLKKDSRSPHINDIINESEEKDEFIEKKRYKFGDDFQKAEKDWEEALEKNELPGDKAEFNSYSDDKPKLKIEEDIDLGELGLVKTIQDQEEKEEGYRLHAFNTLISSRLPLHRKVPDTRHEKCRDLKYPHDLPETSIVVCFYREAMTALLRTIYSILDRTPQHMLKEIILVDDTDDDEYHRGVEKKISDISNKIILLRMPKREGLIRARIFGARKATGEVLVFLDSHVEVNQVWLEPLLLRIKENFTNVVTPIIDVISPDTFQYSGATLVRGGFNWGLHFKWDSIPIHYFEDKSNFIKPIRSPTMAGGLFAIDRKYFTDLGEYDPGMDVWGGENLEISFRIWMCGGTLEILPCSRVGHIFRKRRPYGDTKGQDSLLKNSLRLARVWMDKYIDKFYKIRPQARYAGYGDITDRTRLRYRLGCKSFQWYLDNIYPSILHKANDSSNSLPVLGGRKFERWDKRKRNYLNQWQIQLWNSSLCMESEEEPSHKGSRLIMSPCAALPRQLFYQTDKNELILAKLLCLEASSKIPKLGKCHDMGGNQEWKINRQENVALYNIASGLCLAATEKRSGAYLDMALCSSPSLATWNIVDPITML